MCRKGEHIDVENVVVWVAPEQSSTGRWKPKMVKVDKCIAPIIRALTDAGVYTTSCCCGHGEHEGVIKLADGRALIILDEKSHKRYWEMIDFRPGKLRSITEWLKSVTTKEGN